MAGQKELLAALSSQPLSSNTFIYPNDLGSPGAEPFVLFTVRKSIDDSENFGNIGLYLPPTLQASYAADYEDFELTFSKANDITKSAWGALQSAVMGGQLTDQGSALLSKMGDNLGGALLGKEVKEAGYHSRKLVNPHMAVLFKGMRFREFAFKFHFMPNNAAESLEVKNIIYYFKRFMHPAQLAGEDAFFDYPYNFDITFFSKSNDSGAQQGPSQPRANQNQDVAASDQTLFKMKRCVLMNMNVDYAGSGIPSFFKANGEPVDIRLDMTFKETAILTRKDIEDGY